MLCLRFRLVTATEWKAAADLRGCVYFVRDSDQDRVKIGYSREPDRRLRALQTGSSGTLKIVGLLAGSVEAERTIHRDLAGFGVRGEWFAAEGALKWLAVKTAGAAQGRCVVDLLDRPPVQVLWEWDAKAKAHVKHIWNPEKRLWVKVDHGGVANARPGWSATGIEVPEE